MIKKTKNLKLFFDQQKTKTLNGFLIKAKQNTLNCFFDQFFFSPIKKAELMLPDPLELSAMLNLKNKNAKKRHFFLTFDVGQAAFFPHWIDLHAFRSCWPAH